MCGISGIVSLHGDAVSEIELNAMSRRISHRGGDAAGVALISSQAGVLAISHHRETAGPLSQISPLCQSTHAQPDIGIAHQRFSIVDLTSNADQPFSSSDGTICAVFNGEIYNHVELREELASLGCRFRTHSDTEVLVEAYRTWGTSCFARFNGFWAVAIYDHRRRGVILSRDRIGKKPLYWTRQGARFYFASEIKALLAVESIWSTRKVNEAKAFDWLALGLRDTDSSTMFDGVHMFPAAHWAIIDRSFPGRAERFWQLPAPESRLTEREMPAGEAASALRELLVDSVRLRQRADVPSCVELSGGLDSSVIAAAACAANRRIHAFTVSYPETELSEVAFARSVAKHLNLEHHIIEHTDRSLWGCIGSFVDLHEEPFHSPNMRANQAIWETMRANGFRVSLNGAAGDELLGGYGHHFFAAQSRNLRSGRLLELIRNGYRWSEARNPFHGLVSTGLHLVPGLSRWRTAGNQDSSTAALLHTKGRATKSWTEGVTLDAILREEVLKSKIPYWMASGDKNFMGVPIEVRMPFLDYRIVDLAFRLPESYLVQSGWHKWILRKAFCGVLPAAVIWRKRKLGFPFPMDRFLAESRPIVDLIVSESDNPFIDLDRSASFRNDWRFLSFLLWYERFFNQNDQLFNQIEALANESPASGYRSRFVNGSPTHG